MVTLVILQKQATIMGEPPKPATKTTPVRMKSELPHASVVIQGVVHHDGWGEQAEPPHVKMNARGQRDAHFDSGDVPANKTLCSS